MNTNNIFLAKFLIISDEHHEIVDLLNPSEKYELLPGFDVPKVIGATGGILQKTPIVCGGWDGNNYINYDDCVVIGKPEKNIKMLEERTGAASVVLNQTTLWVVGGNAIQQPSTEFIRLGQPSVAGPVLPFTISNHSMVQYDEKSIYIIGGYKNGYLTNKTWIVDPTDGFQIKEGPSLNGGRANHGCAKMNLNGRTVLVIAAGSESVFGYLDSVEILDPAENTGWTPG